jgi:predicted MFS family arabinose efflux permease
MGSMTDVPVVVRDSRRLPRSTVLLLAVACGLSVANNYYAQPLLPTIAHALDISTAAAGLIVTTSQISYAAGLLFIVPLGDVLNRRRLVVALLAVTTVALGAVAAAPSLALLCSAFALVGLTSVVAQILVPFSASLAGDDERGAVVGTVMSGLLTGILLARAISGIVAEVAGWRVVYLAAAALMCTLVVTLRLRLPQGSHAGDVPYSQLLRSVAGLVRTHAVLRRRMAYGALLFAAFTMFWTSMAFLLSSPPYRYPQWVIGLFALIGLIGTQCARASGRLADRGLTRRSTGIFIGLTLAGFAALAAGGHHLIALVAGIVLLDAGMQGTHILNQSTIYAIDPAARSRLTTAYMGAYFGGGAAGSVISAFAYAHAGWTGVCVAGGASTTLALLLWLTELTGRPVRTQGRKAGLRTDRETAVHHS